MKALPRLARTIAARLRHRLDGRSCSTSWKRLQVLAVGYDAAACLDRAVRRPRPRSSNGSRPTIFDVARIAGVSYSTVSRVVNGHANVRDETRERVQVGDARAGLRGPCLGARPCARSDPGHRPAGAGGRTTRSSPRSSRASTSRSRRPDYDFLLCTTHARREKEAEYVARLSHGMVDGLLIVAAARPAGLRRAAARRRRSRSCSSTTTTRRPAAASSTPPTAAGHARRIALPHRPRSPAHRVHHGPRQRGRDALSGSPATATRWRRAGLAVRDRATSSRVTSWRPRGYAAAMRAARAAGAADRHLRVERHGRVRRPARGATTLGIDVPGRAVRGRLRRHPRGGLGRPRPHDRAATAPRDGAGRRATSSWGGWPIPARSRPAWSSTPSSSCAARPRRHRPDAAWSASLARRATNGMPSAAGAPPPVRLADRDPMTSTRMTIA